MKLLPFLIIFWASTSFAYPPFAPQSTGSGDLLASNNLSDVGNAATSLGNILTNSAGLAAATSDETGTGANVHADTPTLVTPVIGAATGTSLALTAGLTAASLTIDPSATPTIALVDSDTTDEDNGFELGSNCTDTGSGTEDCDFTLKQQIAGSLTTVFTADADGDLSFVARNVVTTGEIKGAIAGGTSTSGALPINEMTIATAAGDYDLPDSCDSATFNWACVYVRDAAETVSLTVTGAEDTIKYKGLSLGANDELDSPGAAQDSVCVVCMETNLWYVTSNSGDWTDGGVAD